MDSPVRAKDALLGWENFDFPGTSRLPEVAPEGLDVVHLHNLHGEYFDLRQLSQFSAVWPLALTLHDEWLMTGHCAYTLGCDRWLEGCGSCPHLDTYPALRRDGTSRNLRKKARIYGTMAVHVSAPSKWLLERAKQSVLAPGVVSWRVIPNGVDQSIFAPAGRGPAREALGLPQDALIVLFVAHRARTNRFKNLPLAMAAVEACARATEQELLLVTVGDEGQTRSFPGGSTRFVPYDPHPGSIAAYYRAADIYLHTASADNYPTTILEALSCGLPVVATKVGGITEQVTDLHGATATSGRPLSGATGVLVEPGNEPGMVSALRKLVTDTGLRRRLGANAARAAAGAFGLDRQVDRTVEWYRQIVDHRNHAQRDPMD